MSRVVAVIVTWHRESELSRLLAGLASSTVPLAGCVVMDHAGTLRGFADLPFPVRVFHDPANPGPGAGWANGARRAQEIFDKPDILYLDDDVVLPPRTLEILLREKSGARAICPLLEDADGRLWGFPEPFLQRQRKLIRQAETPADALRLLGPGPHRFCWATGACLLADAGEAELHRSDFWMLGEDLEYSMRLASGGRAVFTCLASVPHLPPASADPESARRADYNKFRSLLRNLSYLSFHSPRSAHMWRYLPGNFRRFFRTHGLTASTAADAWACFRRGALCGQPAGAGPDPLRPC